MPKTSHYLDRGRKIPLSVELAHALSCATHADGRKIQNAVNLGIFIQQIQYWMDQAQENRDREIDGMKGHIDEDGRLWFYNGIGSWKKNFPFWHRDTIRKLRDELVALGIVKSQVRGKEWDDDDPDPGKSVTWFTLDYDVLDSFQVPPGNFQGGETSEGDPPGNFQEDPPGNFQPQQRVLEESTKKSSKGADAPPTALSSLPGSYDRNQGVVMNPPGRNSPEDEKPKDTEPVGDTDLQLFLSARFGIRSWSAEMVEALLDPMRSSNDSITTRSAEDMFDEVPLFRVWLEEKFAPWFERNGSSKKRLPVMLRGAWDFWADYQSEQTGTPAGKPKKKNNRVIDPNDPIWDDSNFDIPWNR